MAGGCTCVNGDNLFTATQGAKRRISRPGDAGVEQSRAQRDQGGQDGLWPQQHELDLVVQPLAEGQRHHEWRTAHHVHRFSHYREPELSAAHRHGCLERARRLHVLLHHEGPPRSQDRRRVPDPEAGVGQLPPVHGPGRRARRSGSGEHRGALSRSVQRRYLEPRGALVDHAQLHHRRRQRRRPRSRRKRSPRGPRTTGRLPID